MSLAVSQSMDPKRFRAWSVEHEEYRALFEDQLKQYLNIHKDERLPLLMKHDRLIIVQSLSNEGEIHQIWYGHDGHYSIIKDESVKWVVGKELRKLLNEKDYWYLDNKTVFYNNPISRNAEEFLPLYEFWNNDNIIIGTNQFFFRLPFSSDFAVTVNLGETMIGLPYHLPRNINLGLATKTTQIGLKLPIESIEYPFINYKGNTAKVDLNSALGGFARCKIAILNASFGFNRRPTTVDDIANKDVQSAGTYIPDYYTQIDFSFPLTKENYLVPASKLSLHPGILYQRFTKMEVHGGDSLTAIETESIFSPLARLEFRTKIKKEIPLIEGFLQSTTNYLTTTSITINLHRKFGVKLDGTYNFFPDKYDWANSNSLFIGFVFRIKYKSLELPK
jgi:hypothetical protein